MLLVFFCGRIIVHVPIAFPVPQIAHQGSHGIAEMHRHGQIAMFARILQRLEQPHI